MKTALTLVPAPQRAEVGRRPDVASRLVALGHPHRAAFEHTRVGMAILDEGARILEVNAALAATLELSQPGLAGRLIGELVSPEDRPALEHAMRNLRAGASVADRVLLRCPGADSRLLWLDTYVTAWEDAGGASGFVVEMQDVSESRHAGAELNRARAQLMRAEKMASIGHLAAGVAHEINNPLGYVYSNLHTLEDYVRGMLRLIGAYEGVERSAAYGPVDWDEMRTVRQGVDVDFVRSDVIALLAESQEGVQRVKKIVQDLREFSHVDSDDDWQLADLHKGLDSTLNMARNEFKYKAVVEKVYGDLPLVRCVPSQVNQVFMNVLVNAGQAITENGLIRIATGAEGDLVWIEISDNGTGMSAECLEHIFDPFYTTKQAGIGTGLGLSLSQSIVRKHLGRFEVESEPGHGARFRIWLPVGPN